MRTSGLVACALASLISLATAAPAIGHELQQVLQDVGQADASPFEAWGSGDDVGAEKHKKKKNKTKTKYKTKTEATTSVSTTTTTTTATPSSSHHHHSSTTLNPTVTYTSTHRGIPPIFPTHKTSSSSNSSKSSSSKTHKHSTTTISPSPTSTSTKPGLPPIIPPPRRSSSSKSSKSHKHSVTTTITPTATSTSTKPGLPPIIPPPRRTSSSKSSKTHKHSGTTTVTPTATSTSTKPGLPPIIPPPPRTSSSSSSSSHSHSTTPTFTSSSKATPSTTHTHGAIPTSGPIDGDRVRSVFKKAKIIPSVIDDFYPSFLINATFPHTHSPFLGRSIAPDAVQEAPRVTLYPPESDSDDFGETVLDARLNNIVITLTDPDAPSHKDPKWSEVCHWIAVGVPVHADSISASLSDSKPTSVQELVILHEIMPFKPPGPPPKTGPHRYVLLAFTPKNATTEPLHLVKPSGRQHWGYEHAGHGVRDWAMEMGLLPLAGDFFTAEHES